MPEIGTAGHYRRPVDLGRGYGCGPRVSSLLWPVELLRKARQGKSFFAEYRGAGMVMIVWSPLVHLVRDQSNLSRVNTLVLDLSIYHLHAL